jgi:hypothetical protein
MTEWWRILPSQGRKYALNLVGQDKNTEIGAANLVSNKWMSIDHQLHNFGIHQEGVSSTKMLANLNLDTSTNHLWKPAKSLKFK